MGIWDRRGPSFRRSRRLSVRRILLRPASLGNSDSQRALNLHIERRQKKYISRMEKRFDFTSSRSAVFHGHNWVTNAAREFIVSLAVETSSGSGLANAAPLLEEEGNSALLALIPKGQNPFFLHRPGASSALATDNHPVDTSQVQFAEVL